jgi:hypothetical protein
MRRRTTQRKITALTEIELWVVSNPPSEQDALGCIEGLI